MARLYAEGGYEEMTLELAALRGDVWDVVVSHRSGDEEVAEEVARCVGACGLTVWVGSDYLDPDDDGPQMAYKIRRVIARSYCLMVVVTAATKSSWWVPFEIGIASETARYVSVYGDLVVDLPSFLVGWPRVRNHGELREWCDEVKRLGQVYVPTADDGVVRIRDTQRLSYTTEMQAMAKRFPPGAAHRPVGGSKRRPLT